MTLNYKMSFHDKINDRYLSNRHNLEKLKFSQAYQNLIHAV